MASGTSVPYLSELSYISIASRVISFARKRSTEKKYREITERGSLADALI